MSTIEQLIADSRETLLEQWTKKRPHNHAEDLVEVVISVKASLSGKLVDDERALRD